MDTTVARNTGTLVPCNPFQDLGFLGLCYTTRDYSKVVKKVWPVQQDGPFLLFCPFVRFSALQEYIKKGGPPAHVAETPHSKYTKVALDCERCINQPPMRWVGSLIGLHPIKTRAELDKQIFYEYHPLSSNKPKSNSNCIVFSHVKNL